jgi:hypothetical protein
MIRTNALNFQAGHAVSITVVRSTLFLFKAIYHINSVR